MSLPKITVKLMETNPEWVGEYDENGKCTNFDNYQKEYDIEVEIVQLNLNTGGMRVRYPWIDKHATKGVSMRSRDIGIDAFFAKYSITENA